MDKLACMRAFVAVVEAGGFSQAARRIGVSKGLVSRQVGQLEENLGVRLLHRTTRRVSATSSGQSYFEQCRPLLAELNELDAAVQSGNASPSGELRVTAPLSFAELHLMSTVSAFSRRFPEVRLHLDLTDRFVCASPDYLGEYGQPGQPDQLAEHACVVDSNYPGGTRWTLGSGENSITTEITAGILVNSARAARELILRGHGIAYLPSFAVADDIAQGRLRHLLPEYPSEPIGIYAVYQHRKHLSSKIRSFIDTAIEHGNLALRS
jgi:DNA-binding transcriptional LysR family regulator